MKDVLAKYSRLSNEDYDKRHQLIDESQSLSHQRLLIQNYIRDHTDLSDMIAVEYSDDGYTGTNFNRPQFQQMLAAAHRGEIQCVIVKDFSRLGRNFLEVSDYIDRIFPSLGIRVISIGDQYDSILNPGTTAGMSIALKNLIYESYSKDLSMKVRTAQMMHIEKGKYVTAPIYGYQKAPGDKHQLVPDPDTAPIVTEIYERVLAGQSTSEIAKELNRRGIPTPLQHKQTRLRPSCQGHDLQWTRQAIIRLVQNPKYTGTMINHMKESRFIRDPVQRKTDKSEWFIRENAHKALVSKEDFERANQNLRHPVGYTRKASDPHNAVFICGYCGYKLQKSAGSKPFFYCDTPSYHVDAPCRGMRWRKADLEAVLLSSYRAQLQLLSDLAITVKRTPNHAAAAQVDKLARIEAALAACEKEKLTLYEAYRNGELDREAYRQKKQAIAQQRDSLDAEYDTEAKQYAARKAEAGKTEEMLARMQQQLVANELPGDRFLDFMYQSLDRVIVKHKELDIHWSFEDVFSSLQSF